MKKFLVLVLVLVMALSIVACGKKDKPAAGGEGEKLNVSLMLYDGNDTYISSVADAIKKYAAEKNMEVEVHDGKGDAGVQNDQVATIVAKKPAVVLINLVDAKSADAVAKQFADAKVPFIFFNREPDAEITKKYKSIFVGTTAADAGIMQGDLLADYFEKNPGMDLNGDGKIQYLVFKGEPGNPEAEARTEYSVKQAETRGMKMENLAGEPYVCNWKASEAQEAMTAALAAYEGKIEAVFCNNDGMAEGVVSALNSVGFNTGEGKDKNYIPVIGVDATPAGVELINSKKMESTVKQDGDAMGKAVVAVAVNVAAGKDALEGTEYKLADDGASIRIPYAPFVADSK